MGEPRSGALVLYRSRPARVREVAAGRVEIELGDGEARKVRPKDITVLHPGPCALRDLVPGAVEDVDSVRELVAAEGGAVDLRTLAELLCGQYTPASAWTAWQLVGEGLHFEGSPESLRARSGAAVAQDRARHERAADADAAWSAFLERVRAGRCGAQDNSFLRETEQLALGQRDQSRLLRELGRAQTPQNAHALLLQVGWWTVARVPYPERAGLSLCPPAAAIGTPSTQPRLDLTHLRSLAIDDEGNRDPDDAVAIDADGALWVHVADVADLVPPGSEADTEARARGSTLYLPEGPVPMLPPEAVAQLGLGLAADGVGPALSFRIRVGDAGRIAAFDAMPSRVRVQRLTYAQAEDALETDATLARLAALAEASRRRRLEAGAVDLDWPEVRIRVQCRDSGGEPEIDIQSLPPLRSRRVVAESMILAGEGAAAFAAARGLPFPYSVQDGAATEGEGPTRTGLAAAFALRRRQLPSRVSGAVGPHRGLGLPAYARATSPMRRYLDLLCHQQLRAAVTGSAPLDEVALLERAVAAETAAALVRGAERQANRHWTLVWLGQQSGWRARGELIDTRGRRGLLAIPALALETSVTLPPGGLPGSQYEVSLRSVDLPRLEAHLELTPIA